jgi:hypothetical protein
VRIFLVPKGPWGSIFAGVIAQARDGDMVLLHGTRALDLAQRAHARMRQKDMTQVDVRFTEYADFLVRIRHDCGIADVEPVSGEWVEVSDG